MVPLGLFLFSFFSSSHFSHRSAGQLDFYIDSDLCWGVELLVEGGGRKEHLERFDMAYAALKIPHENTRVVEFRSGRANLRLPSPLQDRNRFIAVTFSDDYRKAKVTAASFECDIELTGKPPTTWQQFF